MTTALQKLATRARKRKPGAKEALIEQGHVPNPVTAVMYCPGCKVLADLAGMKERHSAP